MTLRNRALAFLGTALSCAGLLVGLVGAEHLLILAFARRAGPSEIVSLAQALGVLALALLLCAGGFACLYAATLRASQHSRPTAAETEQPQPGSVML
jgi:hypothetical protein